MIHNKQLGVNGQQLSAQLVAARQALVDNSDGQKIDVPGVGREVSAVYEQLRNAAEYAQEHLLIQRAIRRFYVRNLSFFTHSHVDPKVVAKELIIELIQAAYIENGSQPIEVVDQLAEIISQNYDNYWRLKEAGVKHGVAQSWMLDVLSVGSERLITPNAIQEVFVQFAYRHYSTVLNKEMFVRSGDTEANYEASLYVSIYRSLFKTDISSVRYDMQKLYAVSDANITEYIKFQENIDKIFESDLTDKITHYINKYGAPLRVLKNLVLNDDSVGEILHHKDRFLAAYVAQIGKEYREARRKLNEGLFKSIVFLLITKTIIGVAIEVPYDIVITGSIIYLPLIVNLLSPVVYMVALRLGLKLPSAANTRAMQQYVDNMLYGEVSQVNVYHKIEKKTYPVGFRIAFIVLSLLIFGEVTNLLIQLQFNIVQGGIFFIFFATANFLGFRLSRIVRELELVTNRTGLLAALRDFLYMPFILLGQWLSEKYKQVNIVALVLDTIIEMPLKTVLRLIRQWTEFINERRDEI